jgi:hypothetical protein
MDLKKTHLPTNYREINVLEEFRRKVATVWLVSSPDCRTVSAGMSCNPAGVTLFQMTLF